MKSPFKLLWLIGIILMFFNAYSQDTTSLKTKFERYERVQPSTNKTVNKRVLHDLIFQPIIFTVFSSSTRYVEVTTVSSGNVPPPSISNSKDRTQSIEVLGFAYSPKFRIFSKKEYSLGFKANSSFSVSYVFTDAKHLPGDALGMATYGASLFFAYGLGSSEVSLAKKGFSMSLGFIGIKTPIIPSVEKPSSYAPTYVLVNPTDQWRRTHWLLPVMNFDYMFADQYHRLPFFSFSVATLNKSVFAQVAIGWRLN